MKLKAIFLELRGVMINDRALQAALIADLLLEENLCLYPGEYETLIQDVDDRTALQVLLECRGRVVDWSVINYFLKRKSDRYRDILSNLPIPTYPTNTQENRRFLLYPDLKDFLFRARSLSLKIAMITSNFRAEVDSILAFCQLTPYFDAIVTGEQIESQPLKPTAYLQTIALLNQKYPDLALSPHDCLAIESHYNDLHAARSVGITTVGVTRYRPLHLLQRRADWTVDQLIDLELDRINASLTPGGFPLKMG